MLPQWHLALIKFYNKSKFFGCWTLGMEYSCFLDFSLALNLHSQASRCSFSPTEAQLASVFKSEIFKEDAMHTQKCVITGSNESRDLIPLEYLSFLFQCAVLRRASFAVFVLSYVSHVNFLTLTRSSPLFEDCEKQKTLLCSFSHFPQEWPKIPRALTAI